VPKNYEKIFIYIKVIFRIGFSPRGRKREAYDNQYLGSGEWFCSRRAKKEKNDAS